MLGTPIFWLMFAMMTMMSTTGLMVTSQMGAFTRDDRVAILFGDASGHGMAAGLVMAVAHASFRTQLDIDPSATAIVGSLNRILCRTGGSR